MGRKKQIRGKASVAAYAGEGMMIDQLVTPEARHHGDYRISTVSVTEGEHGKGVKGEQSAVVNYDCDPVKRWLANGSLDLRQVAAVDRYRRSHRMAFGSHTVSSNWQRLLTGTAGAGYMPDCAEDALDDIRTADKAMRIGPSYLLDTWMNVVVFGLGAGPAGELLNHPAEKAARAASLTIIRLCCDLLCVAWRL